MERRIGENGFDRDRGESRPTFPPPQPSRPNGLTVLMPPPGDLLDCDVWRVERRGDGALLVRVSSRLLVGDRLPDAVFSFQSGDPQYGYWEERFREQQAPLIIS